MAFDEQWRAVADLRTSIVSATTATTANVPSLKKNRKKGKYSVFSSFYSNWQLAVVAVVALTHVNGSYGDMLYMAGWRLASAADNLRTIQGYALHGRLETAKSKENSRCHYYWR